MSQEISAAVRQALGYQYRYAILEHAEALLWEAGQLRDLALLGSEASLDLYVRHARLTLLDLIDVDKKLQRIAAWQHPEADEKSDERKAA